MTRIPDMKTAPSAVNAEAVKACPPVDLPILERQTDAPNPSTRPGALMILPPETADTLGSLSLAALGVENRDPMSVEAHLEDARRTAPRAFPADSVAAVLLAGLVDEIEAAARTAGLLEGAL